MKEAILHKAAEMFLTLGYKSITMDDIAQEMGISKKTIYQHYANKTDLVEDTTAGLLAKISDGIDHLCTLDMNAIEEVFAIRRFLMHLLTNENTASFHQLQKYYPEISRKLHAQQFIKMRGTVKQNLEKGRADGLYRSDIDPEFVSRIYFSGIAGCKNHDIFPAEDFDHKQITLQFLEYHMRAIVSDKGLEILKTQMEGITKY